MRLFAIVASAVLCIAVAGVSAQSINDAQIAHIVVTANQIDNDAGKLAGVDVDLVGGDDDVGDLRIVDRLGGGHTCHEADDSA